MTYTADTRQQFLKSEDHGKRNFKVIAVLQYLLLVGNGKDMRIWKTVD